MRIAKRREGISLLAVFPVAEAVVAAIPTLRAQRLDFQVFSPMKDERLQEALALPKSPVRFLTLAGFLTGTASGLGLSAFTALRWGFVVGGKPILAWVPFTVIAFELSILLGVLATLGGLLFAGRVPRRRLPEAYDPRFSGDRYGLVVHADRLGVQPLTDLLRAAGAEDVREVGG